MENTEAVDFTRFLKEEHQGKWILYSPAEGKVYVSGSNLKAVIEEAKGMHVKDLVLHKVLPFDASFVPSGWNSPTEDIQHFIP